MLGFFHWTLFFWDITHIVCSFSLQYYVPVYKYTTIYLFILLLRYIWVVSNFRLLKWCYECSYSRFSGYICTHICHGYIQGVDLLSHRDAYVQFSRYYKLVFQSDYTSYLAHQQCIQVPIAPHLHQLAIACLFHSSHFDRCVMIIKIVV